MYKTDKNLFIWYKKDILQKKTKKEEKGKQKKSIEAKKMKR